MVRWNTCCATADTPQVVVLVRRVRAGRVVVRPWRGGSDCGLRADPAALARDVAIFGEHGYRLDKLRAFDAFPMTHHVECVALLRRA